MVFNVAHGRAGGRRVVLAYLSETWCFALNAVSYAASSSRLLAMRLPPEAPRAVGFGVGQGFHAAWTVILAFPACATCCRPSSPSACRHALRAADAVDRHRISSTADPPPSACS